MLVVTTGEGIVDRVAVGARRELPLHPNISEVALHQHHPGVLQLLPQHHFAEGMRSSF